MLEKHKFPNTCSCSEYLLLVLSGISGLLTSPRALHKLSATMLFIFALYPKLYGIKRIICTIQLLSYSSEN